MPVIKQCKRCGIDFSVQPSLAQRIEYHSYLCLWKDRAGIVERDGEVFKKCTGCGEEKPLEAFYARKTHGLGRVPRCKPCVAVETKKRQSKPEVRTKRLAGAVARRKKDPAKHREREKRRRANIKIEVVNAYGGRCECCGEIEPLFLTIDHVNNDGAKDRRENGRGGNNLYQRLRSQGFPKEGYRLLCYNCNCARGFFGGVCPHQVTDRAWLDVY